MWRIKYSYNIAVQRGKKGGSQIRLVIVGGGETETKRLKEQVRRNIESFPEDFMFELSKNEHENLRPPFATSSWGGARYAPMAFTEHGILMLSSVLNSDKAVQVNIQIMRAFTKLRHLLFDNTELRRELEALRADTDGKFRIVFEALDQLLAVDNLPEKNRVYGEGKTGEVWGELKA